MTTAAFELDAYRAELDRKYKHCTVELKDGSIVELRGMLRLRSEKRKAVTDLLKRLDEIQENEPEDGVEALEHLDQMQDVLDQIIGCVADRYTDLINELDGDLELTLAIVKHWMAGTQVGEASSSSATSTSTESTSSPTSDESTESTSETSSLAPTFSAPAGS